MNTLREVHSGTLLIRSPMGQKNLAVLTEWPYGRAFFHEKMYGGFCQAAKTNGRNNEVTTRGGCKEGFHCMLLQQEIKIYRTQYYIVYQL